MAPDSYSLNPYGGITEAERRHPDFPSRPLTDYEALCWKRGRLKVVHGKPSARGRFRHLEKRGKLLAPEEKPWEVKVDYTMKPTPRQLEMMRTARYGDFVRPLMFWAQYFGDTKKNILALFRWYEVPMYRVRRKGDIGQVWGFRIADVMTALESTRGDQNPLLTPLIMDAAMEGTAWQEFIQAKIIALVEGRVHPHAHSFRASKGRKKKLQADWRRVSGKLQTR